MTITPEKLIERANELEERFLLPYGTMDELRQAASEIERLTRNAKHAAAIEAREWGEVVQAPYDDCECVVCETLRNPPPPTEFAKELMRKAKASGCKDLRK